MTRACAGTWAVVVGLGMGGTVGCKDDASPARVAPPSSSAEPASPSAGTFRVEENGTATFLIDAPLEKIKGRTGKVRGSLVVDVTDLKKASGQIDFDLADLVTQTFDDAAKNSSQTEHARNWLEIGSEVDPKRREENRWARFTIQSVDDVSASRLADIQEAAGARTVNATARGELWLHGTTEPGTVKIVAAFQGPASSPSSVRVATAEPLKVSLQKHDVKPRDLAGKFLNGALEKVGKKIDDTVQVSLDITARPAAIR